MSVINNQSSDASGKGLVAKNMHWWVIGGVVTLVMSVMMVQGMFTEDPREIKLKEDKTKQEEQAMKQMPNEAAILAAINQQATDAQSDKDREDNEKLAAVKAEYELKLRKLEEEKNQIKRNAIDGNRTYSQQESNPEDDAERKRLEKEAAVKEAALASAIMPIKNDKSPVKSTAGVPSESGSVDQIIKQLASMQMQSPLSTGAAVPQSNESSDEKWQDKTAEKAQDKGSDKIKFSAAPKGLTVFQGTLIPAVLETKIVSDLPGDIRARVKMDVYDSIKQSTIVIPKGSVLVGKYNSQVKQGQNRIMFAFSRLITPDGKSANLGAMSGVDQIGASGLKDEVDTHFMEMFWSSLLIAGVSVAVENEVNGSNQGTATSLYGGSSGYNPTVATKTAAGQVMVDTAKKALDRYTNIPPTITINPGMPFNIFVNKDMEL
jgi:type IV secretion system protein VirB10